MRENMSTGTGKTRVVFQSALQASGCSDFSILGTVQLAAQSRYASRTVPLYVPELNRISLPFLLPRFL
jgi:hypothetical protein